MSRIGLSGKRDDWAWALESASVVIKAAMQHKAERRLNISMFFVSM